MRIGAWFARISLKLLFHSTSFSPTLTRYLCLLDFLPAYDWSKNSVDAFLNVEHDSVTIL